MTRGEGEGRGRKRREREKAAEEMLSFAESVVTTPSFCS